MKKNFIIILILVCNYTYCQQKQNKIVLTNNGELEYQVKGERNYKPLGNNVKLTYNKFFKNYIIEYTNSKGNRMEMTFDFESEGLYIIKNNFYRLSKYNLQNYYSFTFYDLTYLNEIRIFCVSYIKQTK